MFKNLIKILFIFVDYFIWLFIKLTSNKLLFKVVKHRPWKIIKVNLSSKNKNKLKFVIKYNLRFLCQRKNPFSSCLSRSICGMIFLDIFNISNELNLGIYINKEKNKTAHAWISDPKDNTLFTIGLKKEKSVYLVSF